MIEKSIEIKMAGDFDARPIAVLVQIASRHESSIYIMAESKKVNAKSIMGMMSLVLNQGETVTVVADGKDEQEAVEHISDYLSGKTE
ncbi:MAG: HPr family phosphocarrier protein [Lachnospiraceae bacterium]|nr:HPr family phosphocarrier protein [Lachnospiraceae bacterium]MBD5456646.1 HPr family phosphocarrier protein [Lachnospiraceae bacterium]